MKIIPGSDPNMFIDSNGQVRDQFFTKIKPEVCEDTGQLFVKVAKQKRYNAELVLELFGEEPRPNSKYTHVIFKDKNPQNPELENLKWSIQGKPSDQILEVIPEAGSVDSEIVKEIPVESAEDEEDKPESEEMTKKDMITEALKKHPKKTYGEIAEYVEDTYGEKPSKPYIATVKKDLGKTK